MKVSQLIATTRRESPAQTDIQSYALLERAGYIRQLSSGIFNYLNLGWRSLRKIEQILREEMDRIGGTELCMPVVHPAEIWKKTGRYDAIDDSLVRFDDRKKSPHVLAMTHEEVVALLAQQEITSYKQLPLLVYHLQTKFRDELRPRAGLIRVREFVMKDSYSLDTDWEGLQKQYEAHYTAYYRMFARMGLPTVAILSDVGMMGGKMAHEFMYVTPIGEDTIFICDSSGYKANKEIATFTKVYSTPTEAPMERVATPDASTIADLAQFLGMEENQLGKMVFLMGRMPGEENMKLIATVVRGDLEMNQQKLAGLIKATDLRPASEAEIAAAGGYAGYASTIGMDPEKVVVVADDIIAKGGGFVLGANEKDYHLRNVQYGRDYTANFVGDIVSAYEGAPCPLSQAPLKAVRGIEVGNIFQLGTKYSEGLDAKFMNVNGKPEPIIMGSYGIGVGRALACIAEQFNDKDGLRLPISVAPFHVNIVLIPDNEEVILAAEKLYADLQTIGIEVLFDDRPKKVAGPGVKFKDADLRGIPVRVTVSRRSLDKGGVELKQRGEEGFGTIVALDQAVDQIKAVVDALFAEIDSFVAAQPTWESEKELWY
ncbi:MAG: proline--tRNA ligase [Bacteroidota bacterium]